MNAPTPLTPITLPNDELGGSGALIDRYADHDDGQSQRYMTLRFQDDRSGRWSKQKQISLGKIGESDFMRELQPMGTYRTRQYEFVFEGAFHVALYGLQEHLTGLLA